MSIPIDHINAPPDWATNERLKELGLGEKPLGDYRDDAELLTVVTEIFKWQAGFAAFGTLLGLVRDGVLIPHDTDLDFNVTLQHIPNLVNCLKQRCMDEVCEVVRRHETYVTLKTRKHCRFIDIYLAHMDAGHIMIYTPQRDRWQAPGSIMNWNIGIMDGAFKYWIPNNPEHVLQCWYGPDWRIPKKREEFFKS